MNLFKIEIVKHVHLLPVAFSMFHLYDVPDVLAGVTELAAGNTGTETVVADGDGVVLERVGKVVASLGHGTHEDADALFRTERLDVVVHAHNRSVETERNLAAVWGKVIRDRVLDDLQEFFLRVRRADRETVQELDHQPCESFERTGDADSRADLDEDALCGVDVDLEFSGFVDG